MTNQTQRRIQHRFSLDLAASVSDGVIETKATTVDASANGLAIRGPWTWAPGSRVTVRLTTPRGGAVARAVVQRVDEDVMGLSLLVLGPRFAQLLEPSTSPRAS
jgi:hypothetical protein